MDSLIGQTINRLTVVSVTSKRTSSRSKIYLCRCTCGNVKEISGIKLRHGTKSCGCLKAENLDHESGGKSKNFNGYKEISGTFWNRIHTSAVNRKKIFKITIKDAWKQFVRQKGKCALSGELLRLSDTRKDMYNQTITASLDRIDSSKGYTIDNIQWVHKNINYMKWKLPTNEFILWCKKIAQNN